MKTWNDVWQYLCNAGFGRACSQFYCERPNETAKAFWNGILTVLEAEGKISGADATEIWNEICG